MKECLRIDELAAVAEASADDPRWRHMEHCPRCAAVFAAWKSFTGGEVPVGADPGAAERELESAIRRIVALHSGSARRPRGGHILARAWLRPALAAAAIALVAAALWWQPWQSNEPVLRGVDRNITAPLSLAAPETLEDGLVLSWTAFAEADVYQVRFYSESLDEIARLETTDPTLTITRGTIPGDLTPGTALVWRVVALQGGDTLAISPPGQITLP